LMQSTPYVAGVLMMVIGVWFVAVKALGIEFAKLALKNHDETAGITDQLQPVAAPAKS